MEGTEHSGDPGRRAWQDGLQQTVAALAWRWALTVEPPFQPGGHSSWVAPARTADGRDVVLKVGWTHPEAVHEGAGLRLWAGEGAVRLLDEHVDGATTALLLERAVPGTALSALPEPEQDVVLTGVLRDLWCEPPAEHPFATLAAMSDFWAQGYDPGPLDPGLAAEGIALSLSLAREPVTPSVLVTDLHAGNVVESERGWVAIDPKPHVGDRHYDVVQHLLNCPQRLLADPHGLVRRVADLAELDAERVELWLFARAVREVEYFPWTAELVPLLAP